MLAVPLSKVHDMIATKSDTAAELDRERPSSASHATPLAQVGQRESGVVRLRVSMTVLPFGVGGRISQRAEYDFMPDDSRIIWKTLLRVDRSRSLSSSKCGCSRVHLFVGSTIMSDGGLYARCMGPVARGRADLCSAKLLATLDAGRSAFR